MKKLALLSLAAWSFPAFTLPASAADCGREGCGWNSAAAYCRKQGGRLPTIDELLKAWEDKCTGGKTSDLCSGWYWSSKERNTGQAWGVSFVEGAADSYNKSRTAPVYCGPKGKPGGQAAAKKAGAAARPAVTGAKCAKGQCSWHEAAAYCRGSGARLYKLKEWYDVCRAECKSGEKSENCKSWFWLGESENANYAYSGTCDSPAGASVHSVEKTSLASARCAK
ncbi:MAG: hypothetical protein A3J70_15935 [Elusimicrobia bacterium RIFCSPHIGHO2_02_FULL_61_10]|nr:MAG: hypothetical protein A3J70_15935 [Elusimicrobia bacterium RIFCSPHIGHO2_02_FULL_61_10]